MCISMFRKLYVCFFPLTLLSTINPLFAHSDENFFDYGYTVGIFAQTCWLGNNKLISTKDARNEMKSNYDYAKGLLNNDFYELYIRFASESEECVEYLP